GIAVRGASDSAAQRGDPQGRARPVSGRNRRHARPHGQRGEGSPLPRAGPAQGYQRAGACSARAATAVARYVALFNRRDWDGLRGMLADDVRLIQSSYPLRAGPANVGMFFGVYSRSEPVRVAPAWLDGREVIAVYEDPQAAKPSYMMWLEWRDGQIGFIRGYQYDR